VIAAPAAHLSYSWSKFGREAEYIVALYLRSEGWSVSLSPASRGPADIVAARNGEQQWFIQVKASSGVPRLKGHEVKRLRELAESRGGLAVISTLQPFNGGGFSIGSYAIMFYELASWKKLDPRALREEEDGDRIFLRSEAHSPL
jgi:Holliday junction resolvase